MEIPSEPVQEVPVRARKWWWGLLILLLLLGGVVVVVWYSCGNSRGKYTQRVKEKMAMKFAVEIAGALSSFYATYDRLPLDAPDADWVGTTEGKSGLIGILTGAGSPDAKARNPRSINYLDGFKQANLNPSGKRIDGIDYETDPLLPAIYDPWGQPLIVIMDTNMDWVIDNPLKALTPPLLRGKKGLVYSTGPPNADGTRNTDESKFLTSW